MYKDVLLHIGGAWTKSASGRTLDVINPATEEVIGTAAHAGREDLDAAIAAAEAGYATWRATPAFQRAALLRKAAELIRARIPEIATIMTMEQGKPLAEAKGETTVAADVIDWFAEEAKRTYGRVIPARAAGVYQLVVKEPVGIVAAFTPWNFPINQAVRKVSAALAAGCAVILKGPEETPGACAELVRAFADAGLPPGVLNLVYGVPAEISEYLIPHRAVRKISFTGSTAVGKHLAALAGAHMKRATMELGGHAPAIVFEDADLDAAAKILAANKFRNAGQVCVAPTRFLVQESVYDGFMERFLGAVRKIKVGNGLEEGTTMGPLANERRIPAIEGFIADATKHGAKVAEGGERIGNKGYFFQPTVLTDIPTTARVMNEEPFGPLALVNRFSTFEDAVTEANRLEYGLAAYAYSRSARTVTALGDRIESGMISINHHGIALPETPFGGMKDSGYGWEGGAEAIEAYLATKFVTQAS
ncbi:MULTISPECIES: NAD-dependent succinate-semialdehyde dehydrogenase [Acidiphilium]|jgi:succinate-semialdehyde dehydrogenase/glutarate-semialdehyde dehydrogenase|uniref:Succinate semialdehyde dehydrogenase n=2 Tax=Acidiphilium TaxID=522 RepID=A5FZY4_ACICJ|nr:MULTISPECIES: NAD-dependent succinate-semialdehyde dehydrogenase [Acidiphilium]ABQ31166.1 succinate semialdehyde dehydrogenase [Acidiphilium cryptum JF-5]EGO93989.1 Aldehyde dehydrogenase [Acidiphilium sp. PM]KDM68109.1 alpha-ketoglutaric semialdehyde dehydrogenase AraE [Acidiphilium sp. JA12-A1]BAJ81556.1 putative aldehyde dehydrogenase [Acidiphilium multivorum AIU301]GAN73481.1 aldehyde dehydrogenase [Acidiphilium multivorum AIU301]